MNTSNLSYAVMTYTTTIIGTRRLPPPLASLSCLFSALFLSALSLSGIRTVSAFATPSPSAMGTAASPAATTLGPRALRGLVQGASVASNKESLDLRGIVWLEHLNLVVGNMDLAKKFYGDFLGLSRDDRPKHFNLGQQQFHLEFPSKDEPPQRITGSIGLTVPSLQRVRERLGYAQSEFKGTLFSSVEDSQDIMTVTCPWGNVFHLYDISIDADHPHTDETSQSSQKMVQMHGVGGAYGPHRMAVRGGPGIRYIEIACRMGTTNSIADFYETMLGCHVTKTKAQPMIHSRTSHEREAEAAVVGAGPGVHIVFGETQQLSDESIKQMEGLHACIYIPNFERTYKALKERNLVWTNPRFTHRDTCDTWEEAYASRSFRFKDVLDMSSGTKLLELEHETRPMMHGQYMKVPPYVMN